MAPCSLCDHFLAAYHQSKTSSHDRLLCGDEIPYAVLRLEHGAADLSLREVLMSLREKEAGIVGMANEHSTAWRQPQPWVVESSPCKPYGNHTNSLLLVERNMRLRRARILHALEEGEVAPSVPTSLFLRGETDMDSLCNRVRVPLYKDDFTAEFETHPESHLASPIAGSFLKVTLQACDMAESRYLYDQLVPLAPIMLALTAASPIVDGRLTVADASWSAETSEPRPVHKQLVANPTLKYIHTASRTHNDVPCTVDEAVQDMLRQDGVDETLSEHIAHLCALHPVHSDTEPSEQCEYLQRERALCWIPPTEGTNLGWRVQFRAMEVQITDFENAAFTSFVVLISFALLVFDLDLRQPISQVHENTIRAQDMGAATSGKFSFRSSLNPDEEPQLDVMSIDEIINGKHDGSFVGLINLCYAYLEHIQCEPKSFRRIDQYLTLIASRAAGSLVTPATWIRDFVTAHEQYGKDSIVPPGVAHDLGARCDAISRGHAPCPAVLGSFVIDPIFKEGAYKKPLARTPISAQQRAHLLRRVTARAA